MSPKTIIVWAGLRVKPEAAEEFKKRALEVVEKTRLEEKCLRYDLLQDATNPATFYFFEEYTDDEGYAAHRAMSYMPPFRDFRGTVIEEYLGIRVLDEIASH